MFNRISVANFVLLVFLALRNTPLAPLSGRSYEKLRPLHKTAGYTCIVTSVLHAIVYLSAWAQANELESMREKANIAGGIAGLAMVIIGFSTIGWLVRRYYECASEDQ
jgi:cytochrome bd-type quinol oxidase subunit 2